VKALFGENPISGKLPVSIPGFAQCGDGIKWRRRIRLPIRADRAGKIEIA
jgi:hypothetical protein